MAGILCVPESGVEALIPLGQVSLMLLSLDEPTANTNTTTFFLEFLAIRIASRTIYTKFYPDTVFGFRRDRHIKEFFIFMSSHFQ
jgi:hypothetical protein